MNYSYILRIFYSTVFFVLVMNTFTPAQKRINCEYCKGAITGSYIQVENNYFHPDHFLCAGCGKIITGAYNKLDGKYYHPDCYAEKSGLICGYCGKIITAEYLTSGGKVYHPDCFRNNVLTKCSVCQKPIESEYFTDSYGNKYHAAHASEYRECDNCGRLICPTLTHGGRQYSDGRMICNICFETAVHKEYEMTELLSSVINSLTKMGMSFRREAIRIKSVDLTELQRVSKNRLPQKGIRGYCSSETSKQYLNGIEVKSITTHTIYILAGLPALASQAIIAHELTHAWIYENTPRNFPEDINEGSCNFIAYRFLLTRTSSETGPMISRMEQNPDPAYGAGFVKIRAEFEDKEIGVFLNFLRNGGL